MANTKTRYVEKADFFPKELRQKYGLGEFDKGAKGAKGVTQKPATKKTSTSKKK